ncbi:hypothetical protein PTSG_10159 [Salpingoeca rosetta]|uniref:Uncharacterized protein n=1 Tax=Salpingoeca rosetta (strain ATCC 50818 / BSB-021) TaxID=946362 RepID=F2UQH0_SALR5|nr:uncharacterized protein PTSG_10159 [Salpingoeca rosetta]EGD79875.1 hypothetical protein PTSG_10159 [Salpingoeca rosetta]|eukprot:XP_004988496.1 hypothetical protein PTSG_10159 [Salpingoeca rosetta]
MGPFPIHQYCMALVRACELAAPAEVEECVVIPAGLANYFLLDSRLVAKIRMLTGAAITHILVRGQVADMWLSGRPDAVAHAKRTMLTLADDFVNSKDFIDDAPAAVVQADDDDAAN